MGLGIILIMLMAAQLAAGRDVNMDFAQNTWPSVITANGAVILIGQIRQVQGPQPVGVSQQTGTALVGVTRELTPRHYQGPPEIAVAFLQLSSLRSRQQEGSGGWNGVDVKPGVLLLMGIAAAQNGNNTPVLLQAVSQIASTQDYLVAAVSQALRIEGTPAEHQRLLLLREAMNSGLPVLESYAHFALGRKHRVSRSDAASLEIASLLDPARPDDKRLASESNLELELWADADSNDAVNRNIVAALLRVVAQREPGLLRSTTIALHRIFFSYAPRDPAAASTYRSTLLGNTQLPDMKAVRAALNDAQADPNFGSEAEDLLHLFSVERF